MSSPARRRGRRRAEQPTDRVARRSPRGSPGVIRPVRRGEVPRVWEMVRALAVYERLEDRLTGSADRLAADLFAPRPPIECRVAEEAGGLAGYALFHTIYSSFRARPAMWLEDLYVEPAHRGHGLGRALLAAVAREAAARGCVRLGWAVLDWNEPSIRFYESIGAVRAEGGWHTYQLDESRFDALDGIRAPGPEDAGP